MATPTDAIGILLVDDHTLFRQGVREILSTVEGFVVVGEAGDADAAVSLAVALVPDVVLLDVQLPGGEVTTTVSRLRHLVPDTRIIILSMYDDADLLRRLLPLGISGYLIKNATRQDLTLAIRSSLARDGRVVLSVSRQALTPVDDPAAPRLSARELEVLTLAGRALSNAQIARQLYLTEATVKRHLRNVFAKLNAVSRIDAVNKAIAAHLLPPPQTRYDAPRPDTGRGVPTPADR